LARLIFWISVHSKIIKYFDANVCLHRLCDKFPVYLMCSGKVQGVPCNEYVASRCNAICMQSQNNMTLKGKLLFDELKSRNDYDAVVRTDLDALVIKPRLLVSMAKRFVVGKHVVMGNVIKVLANKKTKARTELLRGAGHITSKSVIDAIDMIVRNRVRGFDTPYFASVRRTGATIVRRNCFELGPRYSGKLPIWHPPKHKDPKKYRIFTKQVKRWKK